MELLQPVIRPYAWGSRTGIAALQGRPVPAPGPEAELWMGAHPSAPSGAAQTTLDAVIAADPDRELGPACVARFGPRLPFLLKVLSADQALSIQVHPSRAQAQAGFRAENEDGLPLADPGRNYVDDWPKPELLCALTPFEVLAGLRPPPDAAALLRTLAVDQLAPLAAELESATSPQALSHALAAILEWPPDSRAELLTKVVAACATLASTGSPYAGACAAAVRVAGDRPGDLGVVAMLLMRHAVLAPGQAMFMPAGGLHAYLHGTGIETLANSDNVVRAGLTSKHIDVPELLTLLDPAVTVPVLTPAPLGNGVTWFDTPAPEFRLYVADLAEPAVTLPAVTLPAVTLPAVTLPAAGPRIALCTGAAVTLPAAGPRIALCTGGAATLRTDSGEAVKLSRGESCFIPAADGPLHASGPARLFLAAPGALG
jgi:mannose-6-phosphate isomerase